METPSRNADAGPPDEITPRDGVSGRARIVGIALALVVLGFGIPAALTASPRQCARCHEMKPYYDSWRSSSHRGAAPNCLYCHVKPGVLNLAVYELRFYREILAHFAGAEVTSGEGKGPSVDSCGRDACHSLNRETSNSGDLKINHRQHVRDEGIACPACHPGAVHEGVAGRLKLPPMKVCKQCHAAKMKQCGYCHAGQMAPAAPGTH